MKNVLIGSAIIATFLNSGMQRPTPLYKSPETLQTLCLKHFIYNTKQIADVHLKRILSREKMDPFEEYEHLFQKKVNPEMIARLQILLCHDLKPSADFPMLSTLTHNWPANEPLASLQTVLLAIIKKNLTCSSEICVALHLLLNKKNTHPLFALAEFLIEKGLNNDMTEYFETYPNSFRIWSTVNYGKLTHDMRLFVTKLAQTQMPQESKNALFRLAAQRRLSHHQDEYNSIINALVKNGADILILPIDEQNQIRDTVLKNI